MEKDRAETEEPDSFRHPIRTKLTPGAGPAWADNRSADGQSAILVTSITLARVTQQGYESMDRLSEFESYFLLPAPPYTSLDIKKVQAPAPNFQA